MAAARTAVKRAAQLKNGHTNGAEIDSKVTEPGPIFLQGDHGTVSFRNIRIKELPEN